MSKREFVVRVVLNERQDMEYGTLLECLRYAHVISHPVDTQCGGSWFDIYCPHGLDSEQWSKMNAEKMQSHGFNAVSAPRC